MPRHHTTGYLCTSVSAIHLQVPVLSNSKAISFLHKGICLFGSPKYNLSAGSFSKGKEILEVGEKIENRVSNLKHSRIKFIKF